MGIIAAQKAFIIVFGAIKLGKTTDILMSFPRSVFVAAQGSLKASIGVAGFEPPAAAVRDLAGLVETIALVESIGKLPANKRPDAIVVDDFTLFVAREVARLEKTMGGFDLWGVIYRRVLNLREAARAAGVHVVFTMHELPPREEKGLRLPGSVALPGKKLPYDVPAAADMVLRAQPMSAEMGSGLGWPVLYRCDPTDVEWRTGDRHNVTPDRSPMNLGEILRLVAKEAGAPEGWAPRRAPGLEWHEPWIEIASSKIDVTQIEGARDVLRALNAACLKKDPDPRHAAWAIRDAWDRAVLRHALKSHHTKHFGI
jgi:hypothetical protein